MRLLLGIGRLLAGYLTAPSRAPYANVPTDEAALAATIRAGDVLLVDGRQRVSTAIKYLTQSTWSHAALCVEASGRSPGRQPSFVEADAVEGVRLVTSDEFVGLHSRICRPVGLDEHEIDTVTGFARAHIGDAYVVCLGKTGPILERADCGERIGESYGTSTFYAGTDHREAA